MPICLCCLSETIPSLSNVWSKLDQRNGSTNIANTFEYLDLRDSDDQIEDLEPYILLSFSNLEEPRLKRCVTA